MADYGWNQIRIIYPNRTVALLAGSPEGASGYQDGASGSDALFNQPTGVAVSPVDGTNYVSDDSTMIRAISPSGSVSTFAGQSGASGAIDDVGTLASFNGVYGLACDSDGNVFAADQYNHLVRKAYANGTVVTLGGVAGSSGFIDGAAVSGLVTFDSPKFVAVDASGKPETS